jgi:hypothetical protein
VSVSSSTISIVAFVSFLCTSCSCNL